MENISVFAASLILISYFIKTTLNQKNDQTVIAGTKKKYHKTKHQKINAEESK